MLSNVVINSVTLYSLEVITEAWPLQFQTLFFGFCLGSAPLTKQVDELAKGRKMEKILRAS